MSIIDKLIVRNNLKKKLELQLNRLKRVEEDDKKLNCWAYYYESRHKIYIDEQASLSAQIYDLQVQINNLSGFKLIFKKLDNELKEKYCK